MRLYLQMPYKLKELIIIPDDLSNKISYYHVLFFLMSLPFDRFYSQVILISFTFHTLIHLKKDRLRMLISKEVLILQSVYFITLFCTFYSLNLKQAFSEWDKQLAIFLFPMVFCLNSLIIKKYRSQLLLVFALTCTIVIVYLYLHAFQLIKLNSFKFLSLFSTNFINHNFSLPIGIHATYLSMYAALCLTYFIYLFIQESSGTNKVFYILCSIILFAGLIQLCSKAVLIALLFIINFIFPYFLLKGIRRIKFMAVTLFVSILIIAVISSVDIFKTRYLKDFQNDLSKVSIPNEEYRLVRWHSVLEVIKAKPLSGYGTGSEVMVLKEKYFTNKLYNSFLMELNAHNQYLSFWIKAGIGGLLVYLYVLAFGFTCAIKSRDILFMSFIILIAAVSISENILDVNKGIFFYSFFFAFFLFSEDRKHV
jgi:O-antigen ligase